MASREMDKFEVCRGCPEEDERGCSYKLLLNGWCGYGDVQGTLRQVIVLKLYPLFTSRVLRRDITRVVV